MNIIKKGNKLNEPIQAECFKCGAILEANRDELTCVGDIRLNYFSECPICGYKYVLFVSEEMEIS